MSSTRPAPSRRRNVAVGAVVVLVLAVVLGAGLLVEHRSHDGVDVRAVPGTSASPSVSPASGSPPSARTSPTGDYGVVIGPDSAPHTVVIYEDFLCPFCGALEAASHERLAELADAGRLQVDYRPFDLLGDGRADSYSVRAAAAFAVVLEKSGPVVAKRFHDLLYADQPGEAGPFPDDTLLVQEAVEAGASLTDVRAPIMDGAGGAWVRAATRVTRRARIYSTPTVLVDGRLLRDYSTIEGLARQLEALGD